LLNTRKKNTIYVIKNVLYGCTVSIYERVKELQTYWCESIKADDEMRKYFSGHLVLKKSPHLPYPQKFNDELGNKLRRIIEKVGLTL
jgi:hypothetical protein